jgi:hypothetical protein
LSWDFPYKVSFRESNLFWTQVGLGPEGAGDHRATDRFRESPFTMPPPPKQPNAKRRSREHLTPAEIERPRRSGSGAMATGTPR